MKTYLAVALALSCFVTFAQESTNSAEMVKALMAIKQLESKLKYQSGEIRLKDDLAKLTLPDGFRYLSPEDAETVIVKLWGNPPGGTTLGMIVPTGQSFFSSNAWAVVISYDEDGYVKDADADSINYEKLMKEMKEGVKEANEERKKEGYDEVELVGWAAPPHYDKATHKLYWAKELRFEGSPINTLNYNIRVLGRRGVLVLNAVASMGQFHDMETKMEEVVKMADFKDGHRYADFDGKTDKVAAYGLAALVAGGVAAKAGFFKLLWVGLLAAKKFVIIGIVAAWTFIKKFFTGKKKDDAPTA